MWGGRGGGEGGGGRGGGRPADQVGSQQLLAALQGDGQAVDGAQGADELLGLLPGGHALGGGGAGEEVGHGKVG